MIVTPEYLFRSVSHITPEFLRSQGVRGLVLDVDNTLTGDESQTLDDEVRDWLAAMRAEGIALTIASNNDAARVRPFADRVGLQFVSMACKPLPIGLMVARRRLGLKKHQMAIVGDQLFTDRMAAGLYGIPAYVVLPRGKDVNKGVKAKRQLEAPFIRRYYEKGGTLL